MRADRESWRRVRRQRANPPAIAGEFEDHRRVFQAALAQAEELWDAAAAVGPAARPLPLFYCLSQAGRAVCAAWTTDVTWRPRSHGLSRRESDAPEPHARVFDYAARATTRQGGAFPMVATATESSTFDGYATVAELWASIPSFPTPRALFGDTPRCLHLDPVQVEGDERPLYVRVAAPTHGVFPIHTPDVAELPATYPTTRGITPSGTRPGLLGMETPVYKFVGDDGTLRSLHELGPEMPGMAGFSASRIIRPRVGMTSVGPPSEFLTLWALLFCLSELARYYPDTWVTALDPDESPAAVTLEHGLELALERAPALIAAALGGPSLALLRAEVQWREQEVAAAIDDPANEAEGEQRALDA